ncbi:MAG: hypothetical protein ACK4UN_05965 [Limisphaerales bacterium]
MTTRHTTPPISNREIGRHGVTDWYFDHNNMASERQALDVLAWLERVEHKTTPPEETYD